MVRTLDNDNFEECMLVEKIIDQHEAVILKSIILNKSLNLEQEENYYMINKKEVSKEEFEEYLREHEINNYFEKILEEE